MHFSVLVCIPEEGDVQELVSEKMEFYNENKVAPLSAFRDKTEDFRALWDKELVLVEAPDGNRFHRFSELVEYDPGQKGNLKPGYKEVMGKYSDVFRSKDEMAKELGYDKNGDKYGYYYDPTSKWDWFQIGGRWTGYLDGYNPEEDPSNLEECPLCGGTGMRTDKLGNRFRDKNPEYTCNGCDGVGKSLKWPTQLGFRDGDVQPAHVVLDKKIPTHALINKRGVWFDIGGWGETTADQEEKWKLLIKRELEEHQEARGRVVIVDCHT